MLRAAAVAAVVWLLLVAGAASAAAHTYTYCGHGVHWDDWNTRTEWVRSWVDSHGHHRHTVYIRDGLFEAYWGYPHCDH